MKRYSLAMLCLCVAATALPQESMPKTSKASEVYRAHRESLTMPSYGLSKVKALIKKYKLRDKEEGVLPPGEYKKLSTGERFTYHMIYGEVSSQNCDAMPTFVDEEKHIYAYPPGAFQDERGWSDSQMATIKKNRAVFIPLLKQTILMGKIGCNLKQAILELNAVELIPTICEVYKRKRYDHDILSVLMILMKEGKYAPFLESASYKKLYADENASYQSFLVANKENQDLIMSRAMAYHASKKK
ncbi:MAG: hypothetical protein WCK51_01790 [Armatimonadota bacterium]